MDCTGVHSKEKGHQNKFIALQVNGQEGNSLLFPGTELYETMKWTNQSHITPNTFQINVPSNSPLYRPSSIPLLFVRQDLELR